MFRPILIASLAAAALAACTATNDPYYGSSASGPYYGSSASPPPSSYRNPNNPPGWVDRDRNGRDDRVEQRRAGGYYDSYGAWHAY